MNILEADYVIVGAGSAGAVLAARLSEDPKVSVILIEAGKRDTHPLIHIPAGVAGLIGHRQLDWGYRTVPQPGLDGRQINLPRGRVLGGSSSINGMVYFRGNPLDFDEWEQLGATGWSYAEVLPYFKKGEANTTFDDPDYHGTNGPMAVSSYTKVNPLADAFVESASGLQYAVVDDFNGSSSEGFGLRQATIRKGRRESTSTGYLRPAQGRSNLRVITDAMADRLKLDGKRATGIHITVNGVPTLVKARSEVIVCCGAYGSPALLQRSGIGDGEFLATLGIAPQHHLPGVGENLQDHLVAPVQMKTDDPTSYGLSWSALPTMLGHLARYLFKREGLLASNLFEATGMVRSVAGLEAPDLQMIFMPAHRNASGYPIPIGHGFGILNVLLKPHSRGTVRIPDALASSAPLIDPRFLSDERDYKPLLRGIALSRQVLHGDAFAPFAAHEIVPGPQVAAEDDLRAHIRRSAVTVHHPVGTCRMGSDEMAVLDPQLRVHGLSGLRVVDASAMPSVVRGNTAAAIMMMAERASDMIRQDAQLR